MARRRSTEVGGIVIVMNGTIAQANGGDTVTKTDIPTGIVLTDIGPRRYHVLDRPSAGETTREIIAEDITLTVAKIVADRAQKLRNAVDTRIAETEGRATLALVGQIRVPIRDHVRLIESENTAGTSGHGLLDANRGITDRIVDLRQHTKHTSQVAQRHHQRIKMMQKNARVDSRLCRVMHRPWRMRDVHASQSSQPRRRSNWRKTIDYVQKRAASLAN